MYEVIEYIAKKWYKTTQLLLRVMKAIHQKYKNVHIPLEVPGFEPGTFRMRSGRSTTELHPHSLMFSPIFRDTKLNYLNEINTKEIH